MGFQNKDRDSNLMDLNQREIWFENKFETEDKIIQLPQSGDGWVYLIHGQP